MAFHAVSVVGAASGEASWIRTWAGLATSFSGAAAATSLEASIMSSSEGSSLLLMRSCDGRLDFMVIYCLCLGVGVNWRA
jgi:hypothetical protein